jgi:hypothetical protein
MLGHFHVIKSNAKVHDQPGKPVAVDEALAYIDSRMCYRSYEPERRVMSVSPWSSCTFAIVEATEPVYACTAVHMSERAGVKPVTNP